jgi:F0F1-type ATP synthase epsilon subunit
MPIGVEVVTPEGVIFAGGARQIVTSTSEGDLTVMAEHAEFVGDVVAGVTRIEQLDGDLLDVIVHGGYLQVHSAPGAAAGLLEEVGPEERTTRVTLLAGEAERISDVDLAEVERDLAELVVMVEQLRAAVQGRGDDEGLREAEFELSRAEVRLNRAQLRKLSVEASRAG